MATACAAAAATQRVQKPQQQPQRQWSACRRCRLAAAAAAAPQQRPSALHRRRPAAPVAAAAWDQPAATSGSSSSSGGVVAAKAALLYAVSGTERGGEAQGMQRGMVEEAQVAVEAFAAGVELDYSLLEGRWLLRYTTARDVLPLVAPQRLPAPLQVGRIWQNFSSVEEGRVQNVIEALAPPQLPFAEGAGLTLVVEASYEARTARSIALTFREAGFRDVVIGPALQNLLASPILPRGWWNLELLQGIKQLSLSVPLTSRLPGTSSGSQLPVGINYSLTFLDEDMLIGRASSGIFVFTRDDEPAAAAP